MEQNNADVGIIVGRFQVDELHEAHLDLIQTVKDRHAKVIIFLGLSPVQCTTNNPLDFEARKQMIQVIYSDINILYIKDMSSDNEWSKKLDEQIKDLVGPNQSVALYGGRESFIDHYNGKHSCIELKHKQTSFVSGSVIRKSISRTVKSSPDFRAGVIWTTANQYTNAMPTVDVAILNEDKTSILLARKKYETMYRFVGGFVDAGETFEAAARREVMEETTLSIHDPKYIESFVIDDWRYKNEKAKITTLFFTAKYISGKPEARDDIEELRWFEMNKKLKDVVIPIHLPMLEKLSFLSFFDDKI
jgi:bifunctional NMN adenylyltransferase/nudix hydrolase